MKPTEKDCKEATDYYFDKMCEDHDEFIRGLTYVQWKHLKTLLNATAWWGLDLNLRWEEEDEGKKVK